ncbi:hypothetical protein DFH09DRAFT_1085962 [Mycena vulgaris]|nr:hypothetical protein DFH09DRAFT_1085962 [Mycena vulgaris]
MEETESLLMRPRHGSGTVSDEASVHVGVRKPQLESNHPGRNNFRPASVASDIFGEILFLTFIFPCVQYLAQITALIINVRHSAGSAAARLPDSERATDWEGHQTECAAFGLEFSVEIEVWAT